MQVGDLVMFKPEGRYAKWFGGHFANVESVSYAKDGKLHCRVRWLKPVKYFDSFSTISFGRNDLSLQSTCPKQMQYLTL